MLFIRAMHESYRSIPPVSISNIFSELQICDMNSSYAYYIDSTSKRYTINKEDRSIRLDIASSEFDLLSDNDKWEHCIEHIERPWYFLESYLNILVSRQGLTSYTDRIVSQTTLTLAKMGYKLVKCPYRYHKNIRVKDAISFYIFNDMRIYFEHGVFYTPEGHASRPDKSINYVGDSI